MTGLALGPDPPAVDLGDVPGDRETEAVALLGARVVRLIEALEDVRQILRRVSPARYR